MRRNATITVYIVEPFPYEKLTMESGAITNEEGTDQAAALVTQWVSTAKGANVAGTSLQLSAPANIVYLQDLLVHRKLPSPSPGSSEDLANKIMQELAALGAELDSLKDDAKSAVENYISETAELYLQIADIAEPYPRPLDLNHKTPKRLFNKPTPDPTTGAGYMQWAQDMTEDITTQGTDTTKIWNYLVTPCQNRATGKTPADPPPQLGPWLPPARTCTNGNTKTQPPPLFDKYDMEYATLIYDLAELPPNQPNGDIYKGIQDGKEHLDQHHHDVVGWFETLEVVLPTSVGKYTGDMQNFLAAIHSAEPHGPEPYFVGIIAPPGSMPFHFYNALAPNVTYTVNVQNQIVNSAPANCCHSATGPYNNTCRVCGTTI